MAAFRLIAPAVLGFLLAGAVAGCASGASMDARYDQSLARWKGEPRERLLAAWGAPNLEERRPDGTTVVVYVVHHDIENRPQGPSVATTIDSHGRAVTLMTPEALSAPVVPVTCTTRFVLRGGVVESWTFDGLACGAPG
ncbi:MAG: hypothetical protein ACTHL8_19950 [Burkholderiaceae bacterium]